MRNRVVMTETLAGRKVISVNLGDTDGFGADDWQTEFIPEGSTVDLEVSATRVSYKIIKRD